MTVVTAPTTTARLRAFLQAFDFRALFIEELGWDRHRGQPLEVTIAGAPFMLRAVAEKRGLVVLVCDPDGSGAIPDHRTRQLIERQVAKSFHEHVIVYVDDARTQQVWQWVKREPDRPAANREHVFDATRQSGEPLAQKLGALHVAIEEEEALTLPDVTGRVRRALDVDRVTKKFYERFKEEHGAFLGFVQGIRAQGDREWYASLMLNRLMFVYFIQKKGFLDGDLDYLRTRLDRMRARQGDGTFLSFYRHFLLRLFHEGLGQQPQTRPSDFDDLLGRVPYLNGGLFDVHAIEEQNPEIEIPDAAFERLFDFFAGYTWHLDERPVRGDREINPDVLGYIFEKYVNQKQMGAYYTKEDITEYIAKNTVIPFLFDAARKETAASFKPDAYVWRLLQEDPDRYIYEPVRKGSDRSLPPEIAAGIAEVSKRGGWNRPTAEDYALPTEIWREVVARRSRYEELWNKLVSGDITEINDLITYNLDIRQFAEDAIRFSERPELPRAFYRAIRQVTVLDPTCGSGAFLFAALNVLEPLYDACLDRMQVFVADLDRSEEPHRPEKFRDFREILAEVERHPNRRYFVLKQIVLHNLYGVDIMEEAVEICKLRLFLKLVAQLEHADQIEPLPDIDFNIRAGNTLVGFATYDEVRKAVLGGEQKKLDLGNEMGRIDEQALIADRAFRMFHEMQDRHGMDAADFAQAKRDLRGRLRALGDELDRYLAQGYGVAPDRSPAAFAEWRQSHQPFHWFVEFYGIMKRGGFDAIIGNPPYLEQSRLHGLYSPRNYVTSASRDIYAWVVERSLCLGVKGRRIGLIIPVSFASSGSFGLLRDIVAICETSLWLSHFANRPGQLFSGAQNRLTIMLSSFSSTDHNVYSTRYHRWNTAGCERDALFDLFSYVPLKDLGRQFHGLFPKIGGDEGVSLIGKMLARSHLRQDVVVRGPNQVYWVRVPGYFCQFFLQPPKARPEGGGEERVRGEVNSIAACSPEEQRALYAVLNSSTFYAFFCTYTDGRHINPSDVLEFPLGFNELRQDVMANLIARSNELEKCQHANTIQRRKSGLLIDSMDSKFCKPIIDKIDRVLARHYGFTEEELDFIINYDVKYRMGRDGAAEDGDA